MQALIGAEPCPLWNLHPKNITEWKELVRKTTEAGKAGLEALREQAGVTVVPGTMAGVPVFTITPRKPRPENAGRVLLHFHGGGYVHNPGEAGIQEAILMSAMGGFTELSVDYRMAPDFPYPAAMDDAVAVYRELLKTTPAEKIGVFGTSTGGGMTLALVLRAKAEGLPLLPPSPRELPGRI